MRLSLLYAYVAPFLYPTAFQSFLLLRFFDIASLPVIP